jgi:hypothetical protein
MAYETPPRPTVILLWTYHLLDLYGQCPAAVQGKRES